MKEGSCLVEFTRVCNDVLCKFSEMEKEEEGLRAGSHVVMLVVT